MLHEALLIEVGVLEVMTGSNHALSSLQAEQKAGANGAASPPSPAAASPPSPAADDLAEDVRQDAFVEPEELVRIVT